MLGVYQPTQPFRRMPAGHLRKKIADGARNSRVSKKKPEEAKVIKTASEMEDPIVNEEAYSVTFHTKIHSPAQETSSLEFEKIPKRSICKLEQAIGASNKAMDERDFAVQLVRKNLEESKPFTLNDSVLNIDTMEISMVGEDVSFSDTLKKRFTKNNEFFAPRSQTTKKMKKPKLLKSDGQTVTAESVMRMVDPSFLVCSDADDTSMVSVNGDKNGGAIKMTNFLDDLNKMGPIDKALKAPSGLSKAFTLDDFNEDDIEAGW